MKKTLIFRIIISHLKNSPKSPSGILVVLVVGYKPQFSNTPIKATDLEVALKQGSFKRCPLALWGRGKQNGLGGQEGAFRPRGMQLMQQSNGTISRLLPASSVRKFSIREGSQPVRQKELSESRKEKCAVLRKINKRCP